ncbi:MAG: universal stress protein [Planctomycetes bacterium]|nr:universal stress protein [Planctomycetota bacterium]
MIAIREILVPTDLSEASAAAFPYARGFAESFHARIVLLAVIEDPARSVLAGLDSADLWLGRDADSLTAGLLKEAKARLRIVAEKLGTACSETIAIKGVHAAREIVRVAGERGSDLIVLATHGRTGVAHALMGSTAERVVREAPCPVLAVRVPR